jgi:4-hydroxy-tetrahydrodipicolinate synthase
LIHHHGDAIGTFIGWDVYLYSALAEGAAGVMAGTANVVPNEIVAVSRRIAEGDLTGARELWNSVYPVIDALLSVPFIPAVKAGLTFQGLPAGSPRRPTADLNAEDLARVQHALTTLNVKVG